MVQFHLLQIVIHSFVGETVIFPTECSWLPWQILVDLVCWVLLPGSLFYSIGDFSSLNGCICLHAAHKPTPRQAWCQQVKGRLLRYFHLNYFYVVALKVVKKTVVETATFNLLEYKYASDAREKWLPWCFFLCLNISPGEPLPRISLLLLSYLNI